MTREDRKLWTRIIKNDDDKNKFSAYSQQIRDAIQDFDVRSHVYT